MEGSDDRRFLQVLKYNIKTNSSVFQQVIDTLATHASEAQLLHIKEKLGFATQPSRHLRVVIDGIVRHTGPLTFDYYRDRLIKEMAPLRSTKVYVPAGTNPIARITFESEIDAEHGKFLLEKYGYVVTFGDGKK